MHLHYCLSTQSPAIPFPKLCPNCPLCHPNCSWKVSANDFSFLVSPFNLQCLNPMTCYSCFSVLHIPFIGPCTADMLTATFTKPRITCFNFSMPVWLDTAFDLYSSSVKHFAWLLFCSFASSPICEWVPRALCGSVPCPSHSPVWLWSYLFLLIYFLFFLILLDQ